ncbi:MAG: catalase [Solirubrobacteraceae bacterium]|nr:catalase [Solirubrobacteraceae bacterium]
MGIAEELPAVDPLAQDAIDAIHATFGEHPGRAVHVKGAWARGSFTATPEGTALCRAPFLTGEPIETLVRFSTGGGNPNAHDGERDGRGIAVKLFLADGEVTDLLGVTAPAFSSRTPEDFVAFVRLAKRDPETGQPDLAKLGPFLETHPETMASVQNRFATPPPASWTELVYNGIHAYRWLAADGSGQWVRTRWVPEAGAGEGLSDEEAMSRDPGYLSAELHDRLAAGPVAYTLIARIARDGDPLTDPAEAWPEDRESVAVGRLELREAIDSPETATDIHVFDPLRVCDGIEPSGDPVLHFRRKAYDVSARGRWAGP